MEDLEQKYYELTGSRIKYLETDYIFKEIFSKHAKSFITAIDEFKDLKDEEFTIESEEMRVGVNSKTVLYDLHLSVVNRDTSFDVEMQKRNTKYSLEKRMLHYFSVLLAKSMKQGSVAKDYLSMKCYVIVYLGFNMFNDDNFCHIQSIYDEMDKRRVYDGKIIYFCLPNYRNCDTIELRRYLEILQSNDFKKKDGDDIYMTELLDDVSKILADHEKKNRAVKEELERIEYESEIQISREEGKQEGIKLGKQEGIKEGIMLGKQEGVKEGIVLGKQEGALEASIATAKKMLAEDMPIDLISKFTGLSQEQIKDIK